MYLMMEPGRFFTFEFQFSKLSEGLSKGSFGLRLELKAENVQEQQVKLSLKKAA